VEIRDIGERLEIGKEIEFKVIIGGVVTRLMCSPENLEELLIGFAITEGLSSNPKVFVEGDVGIIENIENVNFSINTSGCIGVYTENDFGRVTPRRKFTIKEIMEKIKILNNDVYKKTRAYHISAVVGKSVVSMAYDIGRHNAVDKAIGMAYKKGVDFSQHYLVLTGRISKGIAIKCVRAGIPLVISKASIFDSAIDVCKKSGLSAISIASGIAINNGAIKFL